MGGRGAVSVATPSLPSNAGQSWSIRVVAGVCGLGVRFAHLAGPTAIFPRHPTHHRNPQQNNGWHKGGVVIGYCPLYTVLGLNTCSKHKNHLNKEV